MRLNTSETISALGFSLIFPPTREHWKRQVLTWLRRRVESGEIVIRRY